MQTLESLLDIASSKSRRGDRAGLSPVDLSAMVSSLCELYSGSADETGHSLNWIVESGVVIDGEERQLSRLVTNLLDNAFKYVPPGGRIDVTLKAGPVLIISDNGPGISQSDKDRIFDRFYRGEGRSGDAYGSGLGLALAKAIAERHGLDLTLEGVEAGAKFRLGR